MKLLNLVFAATAAVLLAAAPAIAKGPNALDAYVAKADPSFGWKVVGPIRGEGYHGAVLELTSQTWSAPSDGSATRRSPSSISWRVRAISSSRVTL